MSTPNKTFIFKRIPDSTPVPGDHLVVEDRPINLDDVPSGGIIVEVLYASFDPYQRGRMRDPSVKSYFPPFQLDGAITNNAVGTVVKSDNDEFKVGDLVGGFLPTAQYAAVADVTISKIFKIDNKHNLDISLFLGPLGMPGLTAWTGLYKIGQPKRGETIFISSAAGAVGQIVGQVAKQEGLTVIGSVGSDEKLKFITEELGFDSGFNYKKEAPLDALRRLAPQGIDINFENVGGDHLEAALQVINDGGRIPACGSISSYSTPWDEQRGVRGLHFVTTKQLLYQGFLVGRPGWGELYKDEHREKLSQWIADGSVKAKIDVTEGIENAPEGLVGMLQGKNFGKAVVKIKV